MLSALPTPRASISVSRPGRGPVPLRLADVRFFDEVAAACAAHARRGSAPRIGDHPLERAAVQPEPAPDRRGVEQVGVVLALEHDRATGLRGVDEQLEVLERAWVGAQRHGHAGRDDAGPVGRG